VTSRHLQAAPSHQAGGCLVVLADGWTVQQITLTLTASPHTDGLWLLIKHGPYVRGQVRTTDEAAAILSRHGITWPA
jgi:hypothetical protein